MKENNRFLICLVNPDIFNSYRKTKKKLYFEYWQIPFLPYLLQTQFSVYEANELRKQINKQRDEGLWGDKNKEQEFYDLIYGYMEKSQLIEEINKKEESYEKIYLDREEQLTPFRISSDHFNVYCFNYYYELDLKFEVEFRPN